MPSPATHLRAPLLWLLLPLMAGLALAKTCPASPRALLPLTATAALAGLAAAGCAVHDGRGAFRAWAALSVLSAGLGGFVLLPARYPHLDQGDDRPPREITVTLRAEQAYAASPQARSLTGWGEIVATGPTDRELIGRRIYYSAIRRISVVPRRTGSYVIRGVVETLPCESTGPDFNDYLATLGIRQKLTRAQIIREVTAPGWFQRFCSGAQARFEAVLRQGLGRYPQFASLYLAMLLGEKAALSQEQQDAFMRSGTFHVFSISGLHIGVIAAALHCLLLAFQVPRRPAVVLCLLLLWLYVQITGAGSPAMRSYLMIASLMASQVFRLPGNSLAALAASALLTLLVDPLQLFSTGFQMSYAVVMALVVMGAPLAERWLAAWRPFAALPKSSWRWWQRTIELAGRKLLGVAAPCWAAFLASTPSGIGYFQVFSPGSLVANLVIIPLSSLAIVAGFLSLLFGLLGLAPLSVLFNSAATIILIATDWLLRHGTGLPGVYYPAHFRFPWLAPVSLGLMAATMLAGAAGRWDRRFGGYWPPVVLLAVLLVAGVKFG